MLLAIPALLAALLAASGCESKVQIANTAPGNVTLSASKCFIETGGTVTLSGGAIDDDGDPLTFRLDGDGRKLHSGVRDGKPACNGRRPPRRGP